MNKLLAAWLAFRDPQLVSDGEIVRGIRNSSHPDACAVVKKLWIGAREEIILEVLTPSQQRAVRDYLRGC